MTATRPEAPELRPPGSAASRRPGRALTPVELAQAAVMGALSAALAVISIIVPFAGGVSLLVSVPMGLLAYRYRLRVLLAATFAACMIAFPIAGIGGFMVVLNCAYVGGATGIIKRRGRGTPTVIAVGAAAGFVLGLFIIAALTVLERLRTVTFAAITANVEGTVRFMSLFEPLRPGAEQAKSVFTTALHYWPVLMMVYAMVTIIIVSLIGWWALSRVLDRLRGIPDVHKLEPPVDGAPPAPVPVRLTEILPGMVETEFSVVRFDGDQERADAVYAGLTPLVADDVAEVISFVASRPPHVNLDEIVIKPRDQANARRNIKTG